MSVRNIRSAAKFQQTVLLIDDQPMVLDIHVAILNSLKLNLNIVTMTDPIEALAWMKNKPVDLIITDFKMMKMDGIKFVQAIKSDSHVLQRAIVVVTALKDLSLHQTLIAEGASACLTKPVNPTELANITKKLLLQSQAYYTAGLIE